MDPAFVVAYFSIGSAAIPLLASAARPKHLSVEARYVRYIAIGALVCDMISLVLSLYSVNSLLLANGFQLFQIFLLIRIYSVQRSNSRPLRIVFWCLVAVYIINTAFFDGPWKFNSTFMAASSLVMIILPLHYFYVLLTELPTTHIQRLPMLWISFAVLIYYAGNFFQFLTTNYILAGDADAARMLWILHNLLNILKIFCSQSQYGRAIAE